MAPRAQDAAFAKMFGKKAVAAAGKEAMKCVVPRSTIGLFAFRDLLTVGAAFTVRAAAGCLQLTGPSPCALRAQLYSLPCDLLSALPASEPSVSGGGGERDCI